MNLLNTATNVWNRRALFLIYPKTTLESVQKNSSALIHPNSSLSKLLIFTETTAAVNSNLGMVVTLVGETRDFPTTKAQ